MKKALQKFHGRPRAIDAGQLMPLVQAFSEHMTTLGYKPLAVERYAGSARHFASWLRLSDIAVTDVNDSSVEQFASHQCECTFSNLWRHNRRERHSLGRVRHFVRFLVETGVAKTQAPVAEPAGKRITEFKEWLRNHRGIHEETIERYSYLILRLLPSLGDDPSTYNARLVKAVVLEQANKEPRLRAKNTLTVLRHYLKFLATRGECQPWLAQAVPTIAHWRLSSLPRYLLPDEIEKLIDRHNFEHRTGARDYAILLLLARLGLRAGDIVDMRLDDIEWDKGTLRVRGKGRQEVRLPLPQDAGDALLDYLTGSRPRVPMDHVFLALFAPYRPFASSCCVSMIVSSALTRAGITDTPSRGAHLLRHSMATAMLRSGASLDTVGAILRHRSPDTTAIYAKVDLPMLSQIAQTWQGGQSC